ncbi:MAG: hypothetical protein JG766_1078 [Desulfacinum sp.]|jgi:hypothetical protein|nr:hypothetical protein [Desulfacinum sp.]
MTPIKARWPLPPRFCNPDWTIFSQGAAPKGGRKARLYIDPLPQMNAYGRKWT